jgi:hypothetical protein
MASSSLAKFSANRPAPNDPAESVRPAKFHHQAAVRPPAIYGILDQPGPKSQIPALFNSYESSGLEFNVVPGGHNNFEIVITLK